MGTPRESSRTRSHLKRRHRRLGLNISNKVVRQHANQVTADSETYHFTETIIKPAFRKMGLPCTAPPAPTPAFQQQLPAAARRTTPSRHGTGMLASAPVSGRTPRVARHRLVATDPVDIGPSPPTGHSCAFGHAPGSSGSRLPLSAPIPKARASNRETLLRYWNIRLGMFHVTEYQFRSWESALRNTKRLINGGLNCQLNADWPLQMLRSNL